MKSPLDRHLKKMGKFVPTKNQIFFICGVALVLSYFFPYQRKTFSDNYPLTKTSEKTEKHLSRLVVKTAYSV